MLANVVSNSKAADNPLSGKSNFNFNGYPRTPRVQIP